MFAINVSVSVRERYKTNTRSTITALVENRPGVLNRVVSSTIAVEGGGRVKAELVSVGQSGEQSLKRIEAGGDRVVVRVEPIHVPQAPEVRRPGIEILCSERCRTVDLVRLDHFRGFEKYWEIPGDHETAEHGRWAVYLLSLLGCYWLLPTSLEAWNPLPLMPRMLLPVLPVAAILAGLTQIDVDRVDVVAFVLQPDGQRDIRLYVAQSSSGQQRDTHQNLSLTWKVA